MQLGKLLVSPILKQEEAQYLKLMETHHYLGAIRKIGETMWYSATYNDQPVALISFSAAVLNCLARDRWIGWSYRHRTGRLKLLANNSRFLILPSWNNKNLGSRILSLCLKRLSKDWCEKYGHPILLVETFVDPSRYHGGVYRASNWQAIGKTRGYRRITGGYSATRSETQKIIFVKPLHRRAQSVLSHPILSPHFNLDEIKMNITAEHMRSLPDFFMKVPDPRRAKGTRHRISTVLSIAAGAILCGEKSYESMSEWADNLSQKARERFRCRYDKGRYVIPSLSIIRDVLVRVEPDELEIAFQRWNEAYAQDDESLAIDGKVMCNAIDGEGRQTQIMSAVGHQSGICYAQKK